MESFLEKFPLYNVLNTLLPGVVFSVFAEAITDFDFTADNVVVSIFWFYFVGMVLNRVGSLIVQPVLEKIGFIPKTRYSEFIEAEQKFEKLQSLSTDNNVYRTFSALFLALPILKVIEIIVNHFSWLDDNLGIIAILILIVVFLVAYRKQSQFISKRMDHNEESGDI